MEGGGKGDIVSFNSINRLQTDVECFMKKFMICYSAEIDLFIQLFTNC